MLGLVPGTVGEYLLRELPCPQEWALIACLLDKGDWICSRHIVGFKLVSLFWSMEANI